jgi:CubicO group peptidase (beta-lactamase class C family)
MARRFHACEIYSITKSFMTTLIGIAIDQGYISGVDGIVQDYFPDRTFENPGPGKDALTLEHLLTMTTGLDWIESDEDIRDLYVSPDWSQYMLDLPAAEPPGERFNYCTGCSHLLSAILEKATGMGTLDFARQHLFEPVGITQVEWLTNPGGTPLAAGVCSSPRPTWRVGLPVPARGCMGRPAGGVQGVGGSSHDLSHTG